MGFLLRKMGYNFKIHGIKVLNILDANYFIEDGMILKKRNQKIIFIEI